MPSPDRVLAPAEAGDPTAGPAPPDLPRLRERALTVLLSAELAHIVDLVAYADGEAIVVANALGVARLSRAEPAAAAVVVRGRNPVALQNPMQDVDGCFPWAGPRLASLFADPRAPDLVVVHTGAHYWPERGGHLGEHGSLNAIQSRAPFLLSGAGVAARGVLPRALRTVDVAATLAYLCQASWQGMEGSPATDLATPGARHVVGLLWDGAQSADLLRLVGAGQLPAVAGLLERGCALRGGAIAEFPSVTLVNHTCALTGVGPGRHGIIHNAFYDRAAGARAVPNDSSTWHHAMDWLRPGVTTVFERVARAHPGSFTACVNDPVDRGADYSTFGLVRAAQDAGDAPEGAKSLRSTLPDPRTEAHATQEFVATNGDYAWGTQVDGSGLAQVLQLWRPGEPAPTFTWWNTTLTDAGHHCGGPGSAIARATLSDADRRLGVFLDRVDEMGLTEQTAVLLTADHGSQAADPDCRGDWDVALRAAGIPFRDEAYGFIYLG